MKGCIREITYLDTTYYTRTWKERQSFFYKATTSAIVPIKCGKETMLGYMKGAKGYVVNQIGIKENKMRFLCGRETGKS